MAFLFVNRPTVIYLFLFGLLQTNIVVDSELQEKESRKRIEYTKKWHQCNSIAEDFRMNWYSGTRYLSRFLYNLRSLNCSHFEECLEQTFAFTEFTTLMYMKFCNESELMITCNDELQSGLKKQLNTNSSGYRSVVDSKINLLELNKMELKKLCLQVDKYDPQEVPNQYVEIIEAYVPFCSVVWCGFDKNDFINGISSIWICIPLKWV